MISRADDISGNLLLYEYIATKRTPLFLHRNWMRSIRISDHLANGAHTVLPDSYHRPRKEFTPESLIMFAAEVLSFQRCDGESTSHKAPANKRVRRSGSTCKMKVEFSTMGSTPQHWLVKCPMAEASVTTVSGAKKAKVDVAQFKFGQKFMAEGQIFDPARRYRMKIVMSMAPNAVKDLYEHLGVLGTPGRDNYNSDFTIIIDDVLRAPENAQSYGAMDLKGNACFGVEIRMGLGLQNHPIRHSPQGLLTPPPDQRSSASSDMMTDGDSSASPSLDEEEPESLVTFEKEGQVELAVGDMICPFDTDCSARQNFQSIEMLELHLRYCHANFQFTLKEEEDDGKQYWRFQFQNAMAGTKARPSNSAEEPFDVDVRPSGPKTVQEFLHKKNVELEKQWPNRPRAADPVLHWIQKRPSEVLNSLNNSRRQWKVPTAPPNVTYFHTITRRPLRDGEILSDGDDDVAIAWQAQLRQAELDRDLYISETAKRFIQAFDHYLLEEDAQCDFQTRDALIRFTRKKARWLHQQGLVEEYKRHIAEFLDDRVINDDYYSYCLEYIKRHAIVDMDGDVDMGEPSIAEEVQNPAEFGSRSLPGAEPPYDTCVCGKDARDSTESSCLLICKSTDCIRRYYHLACIPRNQRPEGPGRLARDWICVTCEKLPR